MDIKQNYGTLEIIPETKLRQYRGANREVTEINSNYCFIMGSHPVNNDNKNEGRSLLPYSTAILRGC